ncbi:MAG: hypothetical protein K2X34_09705, partial [Hyphomonadaceae bacterium]|nr:hypothetical protein [Hyphomonadaceae bacterium]
MSDAAPSPLKRRRRWLYPATGAAVLVSGAAIGIGPLAPWVVDQVADGARIWRLGRIEIEGVRGAWLGSLTAERITIADEQGVWIEASNVTLAWRPQDILGGSVRLDAARANAIIIHRQPELLPSRPPGGADLDIDLRGIQVDAITVDEAVYGIAAAFTADLDLRVENDALQALDLALQRTDSDADRVVARFGAGDDYALHADIYGAPGGILTRALGVPDQELRATARGEGDLQTGAAAATVRIGADESEDARFVDVLANWTPERWAVTRAAVQLDRLPALQTLARRIGSSVEIVADGARHGAFESRAQTPFFSVDLNGILNEAGELEGPARF